MNLELNKCSISLLKLILKFHVLFEIIANNINRGEAFKF